MRFPLVTSLVTIMALGAPGQSGADHISARINSGAIQIVGFGFSGTTAISGTGGFALTMSSDSGFGEAAQCAPCEPGQTISLTTLVISGDGMATYRGQTYAVNQNDGSIAFITMDGPSFVLPVGSGTEPTPVEFETPFTVREAIDASFLNLRTGDSFHRVRLTGSGTATVRFIVSYDEFSQTHLYSFQSVRFDFSKKPKSNE
jgi:hypothetical protein